MTLRGVIVSFIMTIVLSIMVLGYAALQQRIDIEGEATVDSTYKVQINSVREKSAIGDARSTSVFQYNGLSTIFHVGLTNITDSITYEIELNNLGTVDAILNNTEILIDGSNNIKVVKSGIRNGDILLANSLKILTITVKLTEATSNEQTANITINLDYTRLKGGTGEVVPEVYPTYQIGDKITFAGSDWYVIEDSNQNQDYITVMKDELLSSEELTDDYVYITTSNKKTKMMGFYWSDTCHKTGTYGTVTYDSEVTIGCSGHGNYGGSKVKEFLEEIYLLTLGESNLKYVDGYKIRLITMEELTDNLGWKSGGRTSATTAGNNVPVWVYNIFNDWTNDNYLTMTVQSDSLHLWEVYRGGYLYIDGVYIYNSFGVRPVINLYKDAIEE